jgi:hypothetical protein
MFEEFDLDALLADTPDPRPVFRFRFGGEQYTLPPSIDIRAAAALQAGKLWDGLAVLLGAEQWERMQASQSTFNGDALKALMDRYAKHTGAPLGESSGSTSSSSSTVEPSKPTSNGSTSVSLVR